MTTLCQDKRTGVSIAKVLLKAGANINVIDRLSRFHILEFDAWQKNSVLIDFLLKKRADANSCEISPLTFATKDDQLTRLLLDGGAKVLDQSIDTCPLQRALKRKASIEIIREYLNSPSFRSSHAYLDSDATLMQLCFIRSVPSRSQKEIIEILGMFLDLELPIDSYVPRISKAQMKVIAKDLSMYAVQGKSYLEFGPATFLSVNLQFSSVLKYLLDRGADVNFANAYGITALSVFASSDGYLKSTDKEILSILCSHGIDLNARDIWGRTAVFYAAAATSLTSILVAGVSSKHIFKLKWLLEKNIDMLAKPGLDGRLCEERSLFYIACSAGSMKKAQMLIDYGYNIRKDTWLMKQRLWPRNLTRAKKNAVTLFKFLSAFSNPDSLRSLCRREIRSFLGIGIATSVKQLKLPVFLQDYLLFK